MAKGSAPVSRLSKEYNPNTLKKELDRISRAVNRVSAKNEDIDNRISREILAVRKSVDVAAKYQQLSYWTEWYEELDGTDLYIVAKLGFHTGWSAVADVQYRKGEYGNIDLNDPWKGLLTPSTQVQWVEDEGTEEQNYPQGGYYRLRFLHTSAGIAEKKSSLQVQLRAVDKGNGVLLQESNTFDVDKLPDVMSLGIRIGSYDGSQWPLYATGHCDLDSLSVGLGVRSSVGSVTTIIGSATPVTSITFSTLSYDLFDNDIVQVGGYQFYVNNPGGSYSAGSSVTVAVDNGSGSGVVVSDTITTGTAAYADWSQTDANLGTSGAGNDFNDYSQDLTASNKNFDVYIGSYDPGVPVFVIALAYSELLNTGLTIDQLYQRASITTPQPEYIFDAATEIGPGDITATMLASASQRASVKIDLAHKGFTTALEDILTYSGTITWSDGTEYTLSAGDLPNGTPPVPTTPQTLYYIFHDPDSSTDNDSSIHTVSDPETDLQITSDGNLAGDISGRRILVGVYSVGTENGEAAFFVSNTQVAVTAPFVYAAKLSALSADMGTLTTGNIAITATVEWGAVAGTADAPEDNATLGASWTGNLADIPVRFDEGNAPTASGLYASPDYFGFYDFPNTSWKTYMDSSGNFALSGSGTDFMSWNSATSTLLIQGQMTLTAGSSVDFDDVTGTNKPEDGATLGADWNGQIDNLPSAASNIADTDTPAADGLYLAPSYLGFWDATSSTWKAYIDSSGNFALSGSGTDFMSWNGSTLLIQGQMTLAAGSSVDFDYVTGTNKPEDGATLGADWNGQISNLPSAASNIADSDSPASDGLYLAPSYLGFWDATSSTWKAYIDSSGNFGLAGDANNSVTWNGTNFSVSTTGTFTHKNVSTGKTATLINGIFNCGGPATAFYDGSSATIRFGGSSTAFLDGSFLHLTGSTADIRLGNILTPPFVLNASSITRTGAFTISATTDINLSATTDINLSAGGNINLGSLPINTTGLSTGDLWNDSGTVKIF